MDKQSFSLNANIIQLVTLIFKYLEIQPQIQSRVEWPLLLKKAEERKIDLISCAAKTKERERYLGLQYPTCLFLW